MGTAHFHDSRPVSAAIVKGSFSRDSNRFVYGPGVEVRMERKDSGSYQTAYREEKAYRSEAFGIVIGSGRRGQSYLYWNGDKLYQLPVSYFTPTGTWCNSPGYTADSPVFSRRVPSYCLECHTTQAATVLNPSKEYGDFFDSARIIYGITCERCHGPGARHIAFHTEHPDEHAGVYIVNAGRLGRQQQLDACALCHSGSRYPLKPAFAFRVGDRLDDFSQAKYAPQQVATLDVHGNQYGLLSASKCFSGSNMTCGTCHAVHGRQEGELRDYSRRCMSCHNVGDHLTCTMPATSGLVLSDNCIDCHMPALPSQRIRLELSNKTNTGAVVANLVRTHRIAVYPDAVKAFLGRLNTASSAGVPRLKAGPSAGVPGYR
jgi:Cytochrome c554 and c-prime